MDPELPHVEQRVYTVGRLDEASEGLLLMTNDGELAFHLMHPRYGVPKTYQVLVAGMEAHVCLMQTALGLAAKGFEVFVARDAVGSRRAEDRAAAIDRMASAGCHAATTEMAMFEWMHRADIPEFRELLELVKSL